VVAAKECIGLSGRGERNAVRGGASQTVRLEPGEEESIGGPLLVGGTEGEDIEVTLHHVPRQAVKSGQVPSPIPAQSEHLAWEGTERVVGDLSRRKGAK